VIHAFFASTTPRKEIQDENDRSKTTCKYIRGWLKALKDDKKTLVMAAAQGQKSADYILNKQEEYQIELDEAA
jgi:antirestriction protein ArdC